MSEWKKVIQLRADSSPSAAAEETRLAVTLTVTELRSLIRETVSELSQDRGDDSLMDIKEAAKFIHQSVTYVYRNWREMGGRKFGKNIRFTKAGVQNWINAKGD